MLGRGGVGERGGEARAVERLLLDAVDGLGAGMPAMSRMVGATSMTWVNCDRRAPLSVMRSGQWMTIGLRVPPRCEPTCLPHWKGVLPAHAQAAP